MKGAELPPAADPRLPVRSGGWSHFLAGVFMTLLGVGAAAALLFFGVDPASVWTRLGLAEKQPIAIPAEVYADLARAGVIGDNFSGLRPREEHNNFFVQPDDWLTYRLRPNVRVEVVMPPAQGDLNLDPPTLNMLAGTPLSDATRSYFLQARLRFAYTTDADGRRLTLPAINAPVKLLIVGDSVGFGVGVDDQDTVGSQLQQLLGSGVQVVNAAVGGYTGEQAIRMADVLSRRATYSAVVYVACENDFDSDDSDRDGRQSLSSVREVIGQLARIAGRFDAGVTVLLTTHLQYEVRDVLLDAGAERDELELTRRIIADLGRESTAAGFRFAAWSDIVSGYRRETKSILAPFALYVDHTHLSRAGNRFLAEKLMSLRSHEPAEAAITAR